MRGAVVRELEDVALSDYTTLGLGGRARRVLLVEDTRELVEAVTSLDRAGDPFTIVGGGSNLVVSDAGVDVVIAIRTRGVVEAQRGDDVELEAAAGEPWDDLVARAVDRGLAGVECLSGIPGLVGATPMQNVGAYGQEVSDTITSVRVLDRERGEERELTNADCAFAYRHSALKGSARYVVLSVRFRLTPSARSRPLRYPELTRALGREDAPLAAVRETVIALRKKKGMVLDPSDPDTRSAGSFFVNPILTRDALEILTRRLGATPPAFPEADGRVKVSAAWLIERAGFLKGHARGACAISSKHALALTNRGGGTTQDLVALAREIRDGVLARTGISLSPEPVLVGVSL